MLTDRITLPTAGTEPEDLLSSALGTIFPDDITNQHGDPATSIVYTSPTYGALTLTLADPIGEPTRRLFSHHLWNSSVQLSALLEAGWAELNHDQGRSIPGGRLPDGEGEMVDFEVRDECVLELGAGTGLAGLIAHLAGAKTTVITDYPAPEVLRNIRANVAANVKDAPPDTCTVRGHEWGVLGEGGGDAAPASDGGVFAREGKGRFSRVLVADCLWMPWQHANLARSIEHFLAEDGRAWVVAGFHTGRAKVAHFFEGVEKGFVVGGESDVRRKDEDGREDVAVAVVGKGGGVWRESRLVVERIWERDAEGNDRAWVEDRGAEDVTGRKRWLVIAVLRKRRDGE